MEIKSFKLRENGLRGAEVKYVEEKVNSDGDQIFIDCVKEYKTPVPEYIKDKLSELRFYFLDIMGYWNSTWDKYLVNNRKALTSHDEFPFEGWGEIVALFDTTSITGFHIHDNGCQLVANRKVLNGKTVGTTHPVVTMDDYDLYDEIVVIISEVKSLIEKYMIDLDMQAPKQYLLDFARTEGDKIRIEQQSEEECKEEMLIRLEGRKVVKRGISPTEKIIEKKEWNDRQQDQAAERIEERTLPGIEEPEYEKMKRMKKKTKTDKAVA